MVDLPNTPYIPFVQHLFLLVLYMHPGLLIVGVRIGKKNYDIFPNFFVFSKYHYLKLPIL
jgi:hypothetical protein